MDGMKVEDFRRIGKKFVTLERKLSDALFKICGKDVEGDIHRDLKRMQALAMENEHRQLSGREILCFLN